MQDKIQFGTMEIKDVPYIAQMEKTIFSMPWREEDFAEVCNNPKKIFVTAKVEDKIIGYCGIHQILDEGEITNVAIGEEYRQRGIAGRMLSYLLEVGMSMGITAFTLEVRAGNIAAVRLYENAGFVIEGVRRNFYDKPKEDALIMWKR